jgi:hypothetical protein
VKGNFLLDAYENADDDNILMNIKIISLYPEVDPVFVLANSEALETMLSEEQRVTQLSHFVYSTASFEHIPFIKICMGDMANDFQH